MPPANGTTAVRKAVADDITVTGKVFADGTNEALPGVSIVVEGSIVGTNTDANGEYRIKGPANGTLVFSYVGYAPQRVAVNNRTGINVLLVVDNKTLNEVVVGYGSQSRKNLSSAIHPCGTTCCCR